MQQIYNFGICLALACDKGEEKEWTVTPLGALDSSTGYGNQWLLCGHVKYYADKGYNL